MKMLQSAEAKSRRSAAAVGELTVRRRRPRRPRAAAISAAALTAMRCPLAGIGRHGTAVRQPGCNCG